MIVRDPQPTHRPGDVARTAREWLTDPRDREAPRVYAVVYKTDEGRDGHLLLVHCRGYADTLVRTEVEKIPAGFWSLDDLDDRARGLLYPI